jgi:hypothetical protein
MTQSVTSCLNTIRWKIRGLSRIEDMAQVSLSGKAAAERACAENVIDQGSLRPGENRRISKTQVGLGSLLSSSLLVHA